ALRTSPDPSRSSSTAPYAASRATAHHAAATQSPRAPPQSPPPSPHETAAPRICPAHKNRKRRSSSDYPPYRQNAALNSTSGTAGSAHTGSSPQSAPVSARPARYTNPATPPNRASDFLTHPLAPRRAPTAFQSPSRTRRPAP